MRRSSPLARAIDIDPARTASDATVATRFHPLYRSALPRIPSGRQVFHGLPFDLGPAGDSVRWIVSDRPATIDLGRPGAASHVVVAHLCDTWRDDDGERPPGLAVGHVVPVGEPLARYTIVDARGRRTSRLIRRRFEINDGILGWGSTAFSAIAHLDHAVLDWRGPHPVQGPGRYAAAGQSGILTIMPGAYGTSQTGMTDYIPSATDDALLWLHAIALDTDGAGPGEPVTLEIEPLAGDRPGSDIILAAVTVYSGSANPLARGPRLQVLLDGGHKEAERGGDQRAEQRVEVDLGIVIRTRRTEPLALPSTRPETVVGWGVRRLDPGAEPAGAGTPEVIDLAIHRDAIVTIGDWTVAGSELLAGGLVREPAGPGSIRLLPPPEIQVDASIIDPTTGELIPSRVRFVAADGRYLPPVGHRDEINPGFFEDTGGDLILGSAAYAYVPGRFTVGLPVGTVEVEVVGGFDRRPFRSRIEVGPSTRRLEVPLQRTLDLHAGRWVTSDSHVHFVAPSTALLQAAAEDVDVVHLLAAQWGDLYTSVTDFEWGSMADPSGRRLVAVGTENRQNVLGHLALLGAHRMTTPLASGGPPEGRMAGALDTLLADWADRCRAAGGLVVAAHFPLPYAEIAADIIAGRIDAIETQALSPGLDDPAVSEWYRFLNLGERLPIVAGTDKMSSEVPVGAVRAYVHLLDDGPLTFDRWAAAVRAGRTFVTSGPVLELEVEGHEPGDVLELASPGRLEVSIRARAAQAVITDVELVVNGRVTAATAALGATTEIVLRESIEVAAGSWIAARCRSDARIESVFSSSMAAHTSAVYVEVRDRPMSPPPDDGAVVEQVILGTRAWIAELAAVPSAAERARMLAFLDRSLATLHRRMANPGPRHR